MVDWLISILFPRAHRMQRQIRGAMKEVHRDENGQPITYRGLRAELDQATLRNRPRITKMDEDLLEAAAQIAVIRINRSGKTM